MKIFNIKKIISVVFLIVIVFSSIIFAFPNKARAIPVVDAGNIFQSTITAINTTASSFSSYSTEYKEYVLDPIASGLAKVIIRQITSSVVNWINSGFEGSPSFITNPGSFFLDVADQITGDFLAKVGGPLTALCSPFSIDIRIALAFRYHPNVNKRYACTLGTIIKNSKNAIEGANINGFTAGDFRQGGWPAFISLTTEPQNNIYGAYLTAESELSIRVANAQAQQKDELNQGRGFLSWKKCKQVGDTTLQTSDTAYIDHEMGDNSDPNRTESNAPIEHVNQTKEKCEIQTPGSVIQGALEANVNGPLHELQLADELNEIVNALFAQLVTQILSKGLGGVSGSNPSDSSSYIYQIQNEGNGSIEQLNSIRAELIKNLTTYLDNTIQYKSNKDQSLNLVLDVKTAYGIVKVCYENKISLDPSRAQAKIAEIDSIISRDITPLATRLLEEARQADGKYQTLLGIKTRANAARTVNEINEPSQAYAQMLQERTLVSAKDMMDSGQELETIKTTIEPMVQDAQRRSQACQLFPDGAY